MCQLTLIKSKNKNLEKELYNAIMFVNSFYNPDGWGILTTNEIIKSPHPYYEFEGELPNGITFAHVRKASSINHAISTKEEVKSHPFQSEDFILAHNGTLRYKKGEFPKKGLIDTEQFLEIFQEKYSYDKNFLTALNNAVKEFTGNFAFFIQHKKENSLYIVRGSSKLYLLKINEGIIINTLDETALVGINFLNKFSARLKMPKVEVQESELLPENTVFKLEGENLVKIGEVKEEKYTPSSIYISRGELKSWGVWEMKPTPSTSNNLNITKYSSKLTLEKLLRLAEEWGISPLELDEISLELILNGDEE